MLHLIVRERVRESKRKVLSYMSEMLNEGAFTGDYEEEKAEVVQVFDDILKLYPAEP